jgi:hypothetical protein
VGVLDDDVVKPSAPKLAPTAMTADTRPIEIALAAATAVRLCIVAPRALASGRGGPWSFFVHLQDNTDVVKARAEPA